jgi:hypothetical protein
MKELKDNMDLMTIYIAKNNILKTKDKFTTK